MGNASAKEGENGAGDEPAIPNSGHRVPLPPPPDGVRNGGSLEPIVSTSPPQSPGIGRSPMLFAPQVMISFLFVEFLK